MRIGKFELLPDRSCYILREFWISDKETLPWWKPNLSFGKEVMKDEIYPGTLPQALKRLREKLVYNKSLEEAETIEELENNIRENDRKFNDETLLSIQKEMAKLIQ